MSKPRGSVKLLGLFLALIVFGSIACSTEKVVEVEKLVEVPVEKVVIQEVVKEVKVAGETIVVEKEVVKTVEVPGATVVKEVVREVKVPGETVTVVKEVVKEVKVAGETIVKVVEVPAAAAEKILTIGMVGATTHNNWSPMDQGSAHWWQVKLVFNTLLSVDDSKMRWSPQLAERWEVSEAGDSYTFFLHKNAKWHDGVPVTAKDVEFTFLAHLNPLNNSHIAATYSDILGAQAYRDGEADTVPGIVVVDDHTIRFDMEFPNGDFFFQSNADEQNNILPVHVYGKIPPGTWETAPEFAFGTTPIGSGPFMVDQQEPDQRVTLKANPDYHYGQPRIDRIVFELIPSKDALFVAMQRGDVDLAGTFGLPVEMVDSFIKDPRFSVIGVKSPTTRGVGWNHRKDYLRDPRIRQAFLHALDRKQLIDVFWEKNGYLVNTTLHHEWFADPALNDLYPYNPAKAKELLDAAGWDPEREVEMMLYYKGRESFWAAMTQQLGEVGFKLNARFTEVPLLVEKFYKTYDYELIFGGWGQANVSIELANQYSHAGDNGFGYATEELDAKIEAGKRAPNIEARAEIYREIAAEITHTLPFTAILNQAERVFFNNKFYHPVLSTMTPATSVDNIVNLIVFQGPFGWLNFHPELWDIAD